MGIKVDACLVHASRECLSGSGILGCRKGCWNRLLTRSYNARYDREHEHSRQEQARRGGALRPAVAANGLATREPRMSGSALAGGTSTTESSRVLKACRTPLDPCSPMVYINLVTAESCGSLYVLLEHI